MFAKQITEEWKPIRDFPDYSVSNLRRVQYKNGNLVPQFTDIDFRAVVVLFNDKHPKGIVKTVESVVNNTFRR
jgi:hypothetical protein